MTCLKCGGPTFTYERQREVVTLCNEIACWDVPALAPSARTSDDPMADQLTAFTQAVLNLAFEHAPIFEAISRRDGKWQTSFDLMKPAVYGVLYAMWEFSAAHERVSSVEGRARILADLVSMYLARMVADSKSPSDVVKN